MSFRAGAWRANERSGADGGGACARVRRAAGRPTQAEAGVAGTAGRRRAELAAGLAAALACQGVARLRSRAPPLRSAPSRRPVRGSQAPGPAGRPGSARSVADTATAAAPGSLRPAGCAFRAGGHRDAARPVRGRRSLCRRKWGRARRRSRRAKKAEIGPRRLPGTAIGRPPGHEAPTRLRWAARVSAAVPDAPATSRGSDGRLQRRGSAAAAARAET